MGRRGMGLCASRELPVADNTVTMLERANQDSAASGPQAGIIGGRPEDEATTKVIIAPRQHRELWPRLADAVHKRVGMDPEYREDGLHPTNSDGDESLHLQTRGDVVDGLGIADNKERADRTASQHPECSTRNSSELGACAQRQRH